MEYNTVSNASNDLSTEASMKSGDGWHWDDASWILCASFVIFTMQTGMIF